VSQLRGLYLSQMVANLLTNKYAVRISRVYSFVIFVLFVQSQF